MTPFSKILTLALAGMIGLSASAFAAGTPKEESASLAKLCRGATKDVIIAFVKDAIKGATNKKAMAQALIAAGGSDIDMLTTIASAAIAAAGRTGSDAQDVAAGLITGDNGANTKLITAAIKLSAGPGGAAVVASAVSAAGPLGAGAAAAAKEGANSVVTTLGSYIQTIADTSETAFENDNTGSLSNSPLTAANLIAAVTPQPGSGNKYP